MLLQLVFQFGDVGLSLLLRVVHFRVQGLVLLFMELVGPAGPVKPLVIRRRHKRDVRAAARQTILIKIH